MKLKNCPGRFRSAHRISLSPRRYSSGMTLLELTVVILVILSLIAVLFIGASSWKKGSDRVLCIINLQAVQKGVRSFSNMYGHAPGATVPGLESRVIGLGRYIEKMPDCPGSGTYTTAGDLIPDIGELYLECTLATDLAHMPDRVEDW